MQLALQDSNFTNLPLEIFYYILSFLPYNTIRKCSAVCTLWRDILNNATTWQYLANKQENKTSKNDKGNNITLKKILHIRNKNVWCTQTESSIVLDLGKF